VSGLLLAVLLVPFVTSVVVLFTGHRSDVAAKGLCVGGAALGTVLAWTVAVLHLGDAEPLGHVFASSRTVGPAVELASYVDPLSAVMLLLATTVAFLVQVYSLGYLADDPRYPSYAALVSLFTGAMVTVVTADDLWVLLVGWELMGACSYFLIAHHWELADARAGAVKAFLITRTADLGLLFAIFVLGHRFGSYRISTVMAAITDGAPARDDLWLPAVLVAVAVIGKSAQVPFHTWLPDAMPGPTPISALIHAATMVAAGVFLVARMYPLFLSAPIALTLLALVAAVTMFLGAAYALFTHDLKRVLAWSTVSQLAYMFGALAAGAWSAAVLHLLAHGAFKALLFLAAGSVIHSVGGATSMDAMGGLREKVPDTFVTMTLGFGALAGVVPLVGFFTKDAVIHGAYDQALHGNLVWPWVAWLLLASMVATAAVTVAYSLRAWLLVFFGEGPESRAIEPGSRAIDPGSRVIEPVSRVIEPVSRVIEPVSRVIEPVEIHDAPAVMRVPLVLLAVPTVLGGLVVTIPGVLGTVPTIGSRVIDGSRVIEPVEMFHWSTSVLMTVLVLGTGALVLRRYQRHGRDLWPRIAVPHTPVDRVWDRGLVRPVRRLAVIVRAGDRDVIDAYADGAAATARGLGGLVRRSQNGSVQSYLMVVVVGAAAIAVLAGVLA
jgi:NADH-quinone oxidoreductase subunit L